MSLLFIPCFYKSDNCQSFLHRFQEQTQCATSRSRNTMEQHNVRLESFETPYQCLLLLVSHCQDYAITKVLGHPFSLELMWVPGLIRTQLHSWKALFTNTEVWKWSNNKCTVWLNKSSILRNANKQIQYKQTLWNDSVSYTRNNHLFWASYLDFFTVDQKLMILQS